MISHAASVPSRTCVRCSRDASACASYKSYRVGALRVDDVVECLQAF